MLRMLAALGFALLTANCSSLDGIGGDRQRADSDPLVTYALDTNESRPVTSVFVRIPGAAGSVLKVNERRYINGVAQDFTLGDGERDNRFEIGIRTDPNDTGPGFFLRMSPPSEDGIRAELAQRFPGLAMQVVTQPMSNSYGAFGLAVGRGERDMRCIYAWQWIEDLRGVKSSKASVFKKLRAVASGNVTDASLRLRVCRNGLTVDQLSSAMSQIVIGGPDLERVLGPSGLNADGSVQRPSLESQLASQEPAARPVVRRAPPAIAAPASVPVATDGWTGFEQGGKRYLAPIGANVVSGIEAKPRVAATIPDLDPSIPSRAYLGPSATAAGSPR